MKKSIVYYVFCFLGALLTACSDEDTPGFPVSIGELSARKIALGSGTDATVEFSVSPKTAVFNYAMMKNTSSSRPFVNFLICLKTRMK